jgi:hypothetical protein
MATITGNDWIEQNGFQVQMWEVPRLGRIVLFKPTPGAGYWDGYISSKGYVAQFDPEIFLSARKSADTANWVESHRIADEAIASYQRKLESDDSIGTCWVGCLTTVTPDEEDDVFAELSEEYWASVDECESNRECGWPDSDADNLDERFGTAMKASDSQIDEKPQHDEHSGDEGKFISIDITDDEARINEEVCSMNQEGRVVELKGMATGTSKCHEGRLARIQIRRVSGEIKLSISL